jgi:hypothetical protein
MALEVPSRRAFLGGLAALIAAPAVVRASSLMPISAAKLILPPTEIIGQIKPIVGAIPEGWIECNGRMLCAAHYPALAAILAPDVQPQGQFKIPDYTAQAIRDRTEGRIVGRYVINGGEQHKAFRDQINGICNQSLDVRECDSRDAWHAIRYSRTHEGTHV